MRWEKKKNNPKELTQTNEIDVTTKHSLLSTKFNMFITIRVL